MVGAGRFPLKVAPESGELQLGCHLLLQNHPVQTIEDRNKACELRGRHVSVRNNVSNMNGSYKST